MIIKTGAIVAVLTFAVAAQAQTPPLPPANVATTTHATTTTTTSKPVLGASTATKTVRVRKAKVAATPLGKVVTVTTKTGKTLHYDCGKAGNKNKTACKS